VTPSLPIRVETIIVDPNPRLAGEARAARNAARACGPWPKAASLAEMLDALMCAEREVKNSILVEDRIWRRYGGPIADDSPAEVRLAARRAFARHVVAYRLEVIRALTGEPAGSA
jgi:hypothetical protein